jgi:predicted CopG family antitoxin
MASKKRKTTKPKRKKIDWEAIERECRIGQLSIRAIAKKYGASESGIRKNKKKYAWERDLEDVYQRGVAAASITKDGKKSAHSKNGSAHRALLTNQELNVAVQVGVEVVNQHRKYISNLNNLADKIEERLLEAFEEDDKEKAEHGERLTIAPKSLLWIKSPHESVTDVINKLTTIRRQTITLGRQAFNLDPKEKANKGSENAQTEERINKRMNKLKDAN